MDQVQINKYTYNDPKLLNNNIIKNKDYCMTKNVYETFTSYKKKYIKKDKYDQMLKSSKTYIDKLFGDNDSLDKEKCICKNGRIIKCDGENGLHCYCDYPISCKKDQIFIDNSCVCNDKYKKINDNTKECECIYDNQYIDSDNNKCKCKDNDMIINEKNGKCICKDKYKNINEKNKCDCYYYNQRIHDETNKCICKDNTQIFNFNNGKCESPHKEFIKGYSGKSECIESDQVLSNTGICVCFGDYTTKTIDGKCECINNKLYKSKKFGCDCKKYNFQPPNCEVCKKDYILYGDKCIKKEEKKRSIFQKYKNFFIYDRYFKHIFIFLFMVLIVKIIYF